MSASLVSAIERLAQRYLPIGQARTAETLNSDYETAKREAQAAGLLDDPAEPGASFADLLSDLHRLSAAHLSSGDPKTRSQIDHIGSALLEAVRHRQ